MTVLFMLATLVAWSPQLKSIHDLCSDGFADRGEQAVMQCMKRILCEKKGTQAWMMDPAGPSRKYLIDECVSQDEQDL